MISNEKQDNLTQSRYLLLINVNKPILSYPGNKFPSFANSEAVKVDEVSAPIVIEDNGDDENNGQPHYTVQ